jgi:hypothetical protein
LDTIKPSLKGNLRIVSVDASFEELWNNPITMVYKARIFIDT